MGKKKSKLQPVFQCKSISCWMTGSLSFDFFNKCLKKHSKSKISASNSIGMCTWHLRLFLDVKPVCLISSSVHNQQANNHHTLIKRRTEVQLVCFHLQQSWKHRPRNFHWHCFQEGRKKTMCTPAPQHRFKPLSFCELGLYFLNKSQTEKNSWQILPQIHPTYEWVCNTC